MLFANVIINLSLKNIDKTFQYIVPEEMEKELVAGDVVTVPFGKGNRHLEAVLLSLTEEAEYDVSKMKHIIGKVTEALSVDTQMISLALWIRENYGGTMNDALKTVMPVSKKIREQEEKTIRINVPTEQLAAELDEAVRKKQAARQRLLEVLCYSDARDYRMVKEQAKVPASVIQSMVSKGILSCESRRKYRNPIETVFGHKIEDTRIPERNKIMLNESQKETVLRIKRDMEEGKSFVYLLHGVTGSGKTEVYMEVIEDIVRRGGQVIVLIPEIALTFQTVKRFYERFGERVSFLHSRLSDGEKFDQYVRAKNGEISIMIGPRSALFTPFEKLSLIIMDEEHENSYKSDGSPKYHARETAIARARLCRIPVILGSATPTVDSYYKAKQGEYVLLELLERAKSAGAPQIHVVDLRAELKKRNFSVFSHLLQEKIKDRLEKKEQIMLFLNRRGYAGGVTCRSCGFVVKCPHCDVSLTLHSDSVLKCHYCGYEVLLMHSCPSCQSEYFGKFGTGTQKIEEAVKKMFPTARVLRMDADTTKGKQGHHQILKEFSEGNADILVGTQMIVKGHDFPNVTLMGILAADLSLGMNHYRAAESTFDLLVQASGRSGRAQKPGEVVIQTYQPEHYSVKASASGDYKAFYQSEIFFRKVSKYPPVSHMLLLLIQSEREELAEEKGNWLRGKINRFLERRDYDDGWRKEGGFQCFGPNPASIGKLNDVYRSVIYVKDNREQFLHELKYELQKELEQEKNQKVFVDFDYDPVRGY